jgi:hypothetical protein
VQGLSELSKVERVERQGPTTPPLPPKGEGVGGGVGPATAAHRRRDAAEWVRLNLPLCSAFAAEVKAEFGAEVRMTFASENGHVIGKPGGSAGLSVSGDALLAHLPFKRKEKGQSHE